jgi:ribosomal protein L11 methyltransferase
MREVVLRVPLIAVEDVLDRLLPIVPGGVREVPAGQQVELRMRGDAVPELADIETAVGRWPHELSEREAPDDWRERRLSDYEPEVIGGRLLVRPEWTPPAEPGLLDVVLGESAAFGSATHPTTRTCLERLLELEPRGSFADLGCGTGVLAVVAALLGWAPVTAIDIEPGSIEAASENARRNGVSIDAAVFDLMTHPAPVADGFAANVPADLHRVVAAGWRSVVPRVGVVSGFGRDEEEGVVGAYSGGGLRVRSSVERHGWVVVVLERD